MSCLTVSSRHPNAHALRHRPCTWAVQANNNALVPGSDTGTKDSGVLRANLNVVPSGHGLAHLRLASNLIRSQRIARPHCCEIFPSEASQPREELVCLR